MKKRNIYYSLLFIFMNIILISSAFSQNIPMPKQKICDRSQIMTDDGRVDLYTDSEPRSATVKIKGKYYRCVACGGCTPIDIGQGGIKRQLQKQMFPSLFQPIFNSIFDFSDLFGPPSPSPQDALRKQQEEELRIQQQHL